MTNSDGRYGHGDVAIITRYICGHSLVKGGGTVADPAGFLYAGSYERRNSEDVCGWCELIEGSDVSISRHRNAE